MTNPTTGVMGVANKWVKLGELVIEKSGVYIIYMYRNVPNPSADGYFGYTASVENLDGRASQIANAETAYPIFHNTWTGVRGIIVTSLNVGTYHICGLQSVSGGTNASRCYASATKIY